MWKLSKINIPYTSLRLNLMVVCEIVLLLLISLAVLLYFSRQTLKEEAKKNAEQTLEATVLHIDNIMMSVEQTTFNVYQDLQGHLDQPDRMFTYSRRIVETNPYIVGCAIVFKPDYYPGHHLYMAYLHRKGSESMTNEMTELETLDKFTNCPYTEQRWYTEPMNVKQPCWVGPLKNEEAEREALITFCLPIYDHGECVGVVASDLSIEVLTNIIHSTKPFSRGYAVLLNDKGSYVVHPNEEKLKRETIFGKTLVNNPEAQEAARVMVAGETGSKAFHMDREEWYVFYKPFHSTRVYGIPMKQLGWSAGMVFLEDDIFGDYNVLTYLVLVITVLGILCFFIFCRMLIRHRMKPLRMLIKSAQRVEEGHYDEIVPNTQREDEIGQLQEHFQQMQRSLSAKSSELKQLTETLKERGEVLRKAYGNAQGSDRMKATFLHYMTTQMTEPSSLIERSVIKLSNNYDAISPQEADYEVEVIQKQGKVILDLLDHMIEALKIEAEEAEKEINAGKEVSHE